MPQLPNGMQGPLMYRHEFPEQPDLDPAVEYALLYDEVRDVLADQSGPGGFAQSEVGRNGAVTFVAGGIRLAEDDYRVLLLTDFQDADSHTRMVQVFGGFGPDNRYGSIERLEIPETPYASDASPEQAAYDANIFAQARLFLGLAVFEQELTDGTGRHFMRGVLGRLTVPAMASPAISETAEVIAPSAGGEPAPRRFGRMGAWAIGLANRLRRRT